MRPLEQFSTEDLVKEVVKRGFSLREIAGLVCTEISTEALSRELRRRQANAQSPKNRSAQAKKAAEARWRKPPEKL